MLGSLSASFCIIRKKVRKKLTFANNVDIFVVLPSRADHKIPAQFSNYSGVFTELYSFQLKFFIKSRSTGCFARNRVSFAVSNSSAQIH